jgi:hypothetical protein
MPDNNVVTDATTPVKLELGKAVISTTTKLLVAAMPVGTYTFQLEVTDTLGASSQATVQVKVQG